MHRIFLPVYRFFKKHKALMYVTMFLTFFVFAYFALKLSYQENLLELFPIEDNESELAFENLKVKDKLIIQLTSSGERLEPEVLAEYMDEFVEDFLIRDSSTCYIGNTLYAVDEGMLMGVFDFALSHVPSFVDTSCYEAFDKALESRAIAEQMKKNKALMASDETGDLTQMVTSDPLGLLPIIGSELVGGKVAPGGMKFMEGHLFSQDSTVVLAFMTPNFNSLDSGTGTHLSRMLEAAVEDFGRSHPDAAVYFHGNVVSSANHSLRIKKDLVLSLSISIFLIVLILLISFRTGTILWQNLLPILYGVVFALACMFWATSDMSIMALGISAVIMGVALSYAMHLTIHFNYVQSPSAVLRDESTPVFLGCLTTIGAFMGLMFTDSDLLKDFGLFATFALIGSTLFALVFLPHFMNPGKRTYNKKVFKYIDAFSEYPFDSKPWILVAVALFVAVGIAFSPGVKFDSDMRNLDYIHPKVRQSLSLFEQKNNNGRFEMYFAGLGETSDEAILAARKMNTVLDSLQSAGVVDHYNGTVQEVYPTMDEQQERIAAWKAYWTPEKVNTTMAKIGAAALAQGLHPAIFSPFRAILEAPYEAGSIFDEDVIPEEIASNFMEKSPDGTYMVFTPVYVDKENQDIPTKVLTAIPHIIVLDPFWYCRDIVEFVHEGFNIALLISSIFVLFILLISFRNIWIALIAFMPMMLSWYVVEGMMAIFGLQFNLINIVISTFIFGIGVDYSIFVMEGLLSEARDGDNKKLAYHKTAIFFSALVLIIVVSSLLLAKHPALYSVGVTTLIGMVTTIIITYTLEPWVFRKLLGIKYFRRSFKVKDK